MSNATLAPYRSTEERERTLDALASHLHGDVHVLGSTHEGRPIRAVHVKATKPTSRSVLVCAGIHGLEYIGTEVALGVLEALSRGELSDVRANADVWVLPSLNPDGYERTWASGGRGALKSMRCNSAGVDLNRNYPRPGPFRPVLATFGGFRTGSDDPENSFYRGTHPLSEPETAALDGLLQRVPFAASVNLHSTMGTLIVPCVGEPESVQGYRELCAAFARAQREHRYRRVYAGSLDRFVGEQEDHQHYAHHTWCVCIEHFPVWVDVTRALERVIFWRYNPRDPAKWVANDVPGIEAFFRLALEMPAPKGS